MAGGATTAPTAVPALMIPIAVDRSFAGNHSDTALVAAGKPPPFAHSEQEPGDEQRAEAGGQPVRGRGQRPRDHDHEQTALGAERVDERAAAGVHQRICQEKRHLEMRELRVGERDVALNGGNRHRQRLAIQVADGNRDTQQQRNAPAVRWPAKRPRDGGYQVTRTSETA